MSAVFALGIWVVAGAGASFVYRRLRATTGPAMAVLIGAVVFLSLVVVPFHVLGWMELSGVVELMTLGKGLVIQLLLAAMLCIGVARACPEPRPRERATDRFEVPRYLVAASMALAGGWLVFLLDHVSSFPGGWDAKAYHFPLALRWLQRRSFDIPSSLDWRYALPANADIGAMVGLATGFEPAVAILNLVSALLAGVAIFAWAKRLTHSTESAALSTVVFLTVPMVPFQAFTGYVDLFGASCVLAAAVALFPIEAPRIENLPRGLSSFVVFVSGLACGLAVGTKPTMWPYAALVVVFAAMKCWRADGARIERLFAFASGLTLTSGFWFARALVATGNPVFPFEIALGGVASIEGIPAAKITPVDYDLNFVRSRWEWLVYPWVEYHRANVPHGPGSGLGPLWTAFCPVAFAYGAYLSWVDPRRRWLRVTVCLTLLALLGWIVGLRRMPRFGLPVLGLICVVAAVFFERLTSRSSVYFRALVVSSVVASSALTAFLPAHRLLGRVRSNVWTRFRIYEYPKLIDELPEGARVLNLAGKVKTFPLAGKNLTNRVISAEWAVDGIDAAWLRRERIDYIVTRSRDELDSDEVIDVDLIALGAHPLFREEDGLPAERSKRWTVWRLRPAAVELP